MLQEFLVPETLATNDGTGVEFALGADRGKLLALTLGVTRMVEQQSLDVSIWGSTDREHWRQLITFPQKSYCGTYLLMLDLSKYADVHHVRAHWRISRWGFEECIALAEFYLSAEELKARSGRQTLPISLSVAAV